MSNKELKIGEGHKFLDNGYINYQKNNHVYSKEMTSNTLLNMKVENLRVLSAEKHMKKLLLVI